MHCFLKVDCIRSNIENELNRIFSKLLEASKGADGSKGDLVKHRPTAKYAVDDRAVWIHLSKFSKAFKVSSMNLGLAGWLTIW